MRGTVFGDHTMLEVLERKAGGGSVATLGQYIVTALLNAGAGRTPFLNEDTIRRMWNDHLEQGSYQPIPGVRWGADDIIAYLRSTTR